MGLKNWFDLALVSVDFSHDSTAVFVSCFYCFFFTNIRENSSAPLFFAWVIRDSFLLDFCLFFACFFHSFLLDFCLFVLVFFINFCLFFFKNQLQAQIRFRLVDYGYQAAFKKLIGSKLNIHKGVGGSQTGKGPHLGTSVFMGGESTSPWEHWSFWRWGVSPLKLSLYSTIKMCNSRRGGRGETKVVKLRWS